MSLGSPFRASAGTAAIAIAYLVAAAGTIAFTRFNGGLALVWPATGILLAWLLVTKKGDWGPALLACAATSFIATTLFGFGLAAALPLAILNIGEAVLIVILLRRARPESDYFESLPGLSVFLFVAGLAVPAVAALPGALLSTALTYQPFSQQWIGWFAGHSLGTLLVVPIALLVLRGEVAGWAKESPIPRIGETIFLSVLTIACAAVTFLIEDLPILFLPFLPMMLMTCRLGRLGASLSTLLLAVVATGLTIENLGPVAHLDGDLAYRAQYLQFYLVTAALLVLPAAAALKERGNLLVKLRKEEAIHRLLAENSGDIMLSLTLDGDIQFVSPAARDLLHHNPATIVGQNIIRFSHPRFARRLVQARAAALSQPGRTVKVEAQPALPDGPGAWLEAKIRAVPGERGEPIGLVCSVRDITERKAAEKELARAANTDALTGLANRRSFMAVLARSLYKARRNGAVTTLVLLDIDHFKQVNDRHGHGVGDEVLRGLATLCSSMLGPRDMMARIGGEEFALLLRGLPAAQAALLCERLRSEVQSFVACETDDGPVSVSISLGLTEVRGEDTIASAMRAADEALYRAKRLGRNQIQTAA